MESLERRIWMEQKEKELKLTIESLDSSSDQGQYCIELTNEAGRCAFYFLLNIVSPGTIPALTTNACDFLSHILCLIYFNKHAHFL